MKLLTAVFTKLDLYPRDESGRSDRDERDIWSSSRLRRCTALAGSSPSLTRLTLPEEI